MTADGLHSITEVAEAFGLSVATLRFYEERGLISATTRIGRVRHYDRDALRTLAYALLWHRDAGLGVTDTRRVMRMDHSSERHALIAEQLTGIERRIAGLQDAARTLEHLRECPADDPTDCPHTGARLRTIVDAALPPS
ncbi:MerR family transcriptional regulator [Mycetocola reblochoni]|uniref:MerR family transcriptional regulator n=2 Tax=Mycetocola reblochoni TaxID=331618 RepID=A0A3L6ZJN5_9MICO|nr:MerR family DNA-binding transcriptional regulator [Mycetocola reblochoni]RLP68199.1 MerR family transcriptional regulator [Mycetocola reblochoni]SJN40256.1 putative transcriptional regulator, MerR family [Mycetocola reblochoni REB411]